MPAIKYRVAVSEDEKGELEAMLRQGKMWHLAAAHQAGAVLLWTAALWTAIELGPRVSA